MAKNPNARDQMKTFFAAKVRDTRKANRTMSAAKQMNMKPANQRIRSYNDQ